jgi:hypothetical protein
MSCRPHQMDEQNDCPGSSTRRAIPPHPPLLVCEPLAGLICLPRGDDREPRREGRRFSSSTHEMRQPDAANRLERWSVGCGLFESRRRSLGAMGLGEPWVPHQAAAAETDQCGYRWGQGGGLLPACGGAPKSPNVILYANFGSKHEVLVACIKSRAERMRRGCPVAAVRS